MLRKLWVWTVGLSIGVLSLFTGRAMWFELAAKSAEKDGDQDKADEFRRAAAYERYLDDCKRMPPRR